MVNEKKNLSNTIQHSLNANYSKKLGKVILTAHKQAKWKTTKEI